jgi:hypothetical protein
MIDISPGHRLQCMRTGRPKQALVLSEEERERLESLARRARVVLGCAEGLVNKAVAKKLRCSQGMVREWRSQFLKTRLIVIRLNPMTLASSRVLQCVCSRRGLERLNENVLDLLVRDLAWR